MASAQEIINTVLSNAYQNLLDRFPNGTSWDNIAQVGDFITSSENNMNTFMNALINKIAETHIKSKMFSNPLGILKGTKVPYGKTIEEVFINPVTSMPYQTDGTYLLKNYTPDGKACYFGQNRQSTYPITINKPQLAQAFKSEQDFMSFYNSIISALYSGDAVDEYTLMKRMLSLAVQNGIMQTVQVGTLIDPKQFAKSISTFSKLFTFNSPDYNGYNLVNKTKIENGETAVQTFCPVEDQCLIIRADVQTEIDYEVLATMFHMEVAKLEAMTIVVDNFGEQADSNGDLLHNVYAILCDRSAIQVRDSEFTVNQKFIESNLSWNVFLHHWQFIYLSMFANCVAFVEK